jgi:prepilin-type N-terminal cleavage/methylation domain-containing protein
MKTRPRHGFSLIELIGVLAIIAILAGVIAPNVIKSVDRAAVRAEEETMSRLGEQLKLHLRDNGAPPTAANWTTALAAYADLAPANIATNPRGLSRRYIPDPATSPTERVLVLSSMRAGLNVPTSANINNATRFQQVWDTAAGSIPPSTSWAGWNAWTAVATSADYLVIERVNLLPVYLNHLQTQTITMNNTGGTTASYIIVPSGGSAQPAVNIAAGATVVVSTLRSRDRINLYSSAGGVGLVYTYVVSDSGRTFDFDGSKWMPQ